MKRFKKPSSEASLNYKYANERIVLSKKTIPSVDQQVEGLDSLRKWKFNSIKNKKKAARKIILSGDLVGLSKVDLVKCLGDLQPPNEFTSAYHYNLTTTEQYCYLSLRFNENRVSEAYLEMKY